ncbi:rod shape-determining protein MreD [Candidatus Magnetominusculus xianensis]|uniref:Rod shape-determining protein MreD n=1 Tax=Candidatus Magnetominusculus xianensis TaxID=1748249 RepID=A0ABR5SK65_9BACT|nr:rod shape-determining protein MreD [Candidatus Magnetominusculus xianensis]KWT93242.1 rod shape-determining protein MreD [Candidatus Magnetominusculus xianensis]MBF0404746.1 rod shape-determining protein MreD [Nitrospirota bacterium]
MKWLKENILWITLVALAVVIDESRVYRVNVMVVLVYYIGIRWDTRKAVLWAFIIGLLLDSIALKILGPNILSKGTLIFMAYFFQTGIFNLTSLLNAILCFAFTVADNFIVYYSLTLFDTKPAEIVYAVNITLYQAVINAVIGYFVIRERDE